MRHTFKYELKNPDRTITKENWKMIQRYLREVRKIVEKKIDWNAAYQAVRDVTATGTGVYKCQV